MTSLQAWAGVDTRGVSSLNIVSDSRISWAEYNWDQGRKTFRTSDEPHIFGYWGDVLFPALAIPQLIEQIEARLCAGDDVESWRKLLENRLRLLWKDYPLQERRDFGIVHGFRLGEKMMSKFGMTVACYVKKRDQWDVITVGMPRTAEGSQTLLIRGSGKKSVNDWHAKWEQSPAAGTSRAIYAAFAESLNSGIDPATGGGPQMVRLRRIGGGEIVGMISHGRRYLGGADIVGPALEQSASWHNDLFEIADVSTKQRKAGAQIHEPRNL